MAKHVLFVILHIYNVYIYVYIYIYIYIYTRGSISGHGGTRSPTFQRGGTALELSSSLFSSEKKEAYSLTHHSSLLKAATQDYLDNKLAV